VTNFGPRIKDSRKQLNMTMAELGALIGVAKSTIAGYEKGFREPPIQKIYLLALHLHTSADYLFGLSDLSLSHASLDAKTLLYSKKLHWDGIPLNAEELELIRCSIEDNRLRHTLGR
jgi:transcriptional regulator with XRE-family HTH domain